MRYYDAYQKLTNEIDIVILEQHHLRSWALILVCLFNIVYFLYTGSVVPAVFAALVIVWAVYDMVKRADIYKHAYVNGVREALTEIESNQ